MTAAADITAPPLGRDVSPSNLCSATNPASLEVQEVADKPDVPVARRRLVVSAEQDVEWVKLIERLLADGEVDREEQGYR